MEFKFRGEKIEVTDAIKNYVKTKFERVEKYFSENNSLNASVLIKAKGKDQTIETTIKTENFLLRCEQTNKDLYAAIDATVDKLERQIRKNKTKLLKKVKKSNYQDFNLDLVSEETDEDENTKIVKRKKLETKPISEEEAILQMELVGHDFYIFKDMDDSTIKVLYRRKDGNYGVIETE